MSRYLWLGNILRSRDWLWLPVCALSLDQFQLKITLLLGNFPNGLCFVISFRSIREKSKLFYPRTATAFTSQDPSKLKSRITAFESSIYSHTYVSNCPPYCNELRLRSFYLNTSLWKNLMKLKFRIDKQSGWAFNLYSMQTGVLKIGSSDVYVHLAR